jgi:hypothetical protein
MMETTDMHHIQFTLTKDEWAQIDNALEETPCMRHHAQKVFELISSGNASGFIDPGDPGVISIFELCGRAFKAAVQEGQALAMLDRKVRASVGDEVQRRAERFYGERIAGPKA